MKKWSIYRYMMLLCPVLILTACTEDFNGNVAAPQQWEQETAKTIGFKAEKVGTIDLNTVASEKVKVCSITKPALTAGRVKGYVLYLNEKVTLEVDSLGQVKTGALQDSIVSIYGKRPELRTLSGRLYALVALGEQTLRSDSVALTLAVKPKAPFIAEEYYILVWDKSTIGPTVTRFNHTGDVYENPIFTIVTKVVAGAEWLVGTKKYASPIEQETVEPGTGRLGNATEGSDATEGTLVPEGNRMKFKAAGWTKIELNMADYTYKVTVLGNVSPFLYVPGNHQGWAPATAPFVHSTDFMNYSGFVSLDGEFKFTSEKSWDGVNYGAGAKDGTLSTDGGAGNLKAEKGFYLLKANISSLTWSAVLIQTFGLIGSATDGGWDTSTPMTFDAAKSEYSITAALKDGELKFRANDVWDVNLGGDPEHLTFGGANIAVKAGTYKITLSLSDAQKYTCTIAKP
ncbi:SusF/SusE family outer membrane protein [Tannerella forsythia]|uniref:SusF/SusE family outer membrane protein n=1 Tax=Tannerella forsythia TaxID=28112 RepID=UPI0009D6807C|nr:SusF/SusE family outer membrane protein [Tannerella forsythia]